MTNASAAAVRSAVAHDFFSRAFGPRDWVAIFLKAYDTKRVMQRVAPIATFCEARWLTWLRVMNHFRFNVYVSVNAMTPHRRERTKAAVTEVRHVFVDVDRHGPRVLDQVVSMPGLPLPSYVVHSSPGRLQLLWRTHGFSASDAERLQKHLATRLGGDLHATAVSQTMRVPGFHNWKYRPPPVVGVEYGAEASVYEPVHFPKPAIVLHMVTQRTEQRPSPDSRSQDAAERARRYLAAVPPAVAGQGGDARTFRVCCRLVRGFALDATVALQLLASWNARCEPPWSEAELIAKLDHARRYGREPIGGLLDPSV